MLWVGLTLGGFPWLQTIVDESLLAEVVSKVVHSLVPDLDRKRACDQLLQLSLLRSEHVLELFWGHNEEKFDFFAKKF